MIARSLRSSVVPFSTLLLLVACGPLAEGEPSVEVAGSAATAPSSPGLGLVVEPLAAPAVAGGQASGQSHLSRGADGAVHLAWVETVDGGGHVLRHSRLAPDSAAWLPPSTVAAGDDWMVNWADTPSLVAGADGHLFAHWLVRSAEAPYAYHVVVAASTDDGVTWTEPRRLHDDSSPTEHGFVSLLPQPDGGALAVWLDGRAMVKEGPMSLRSRTISPDGSLGPSAVIDERTCDCCPTSLAPLPGGGALAAWRDRSEEEVRDIAVARWDGAAWESPRIPAPDAWTMPGCPVNGPSLASDGERVAMAWYTGEAEAHRVRLARSSDGGRTFGEPLLVSNTEVIGRVDVDLFADGAALVTWMERRGPEGAALVAALAPAVGPLGPTVDVAPLSPARSSGMPRAVRFGDRDAVISWTEVGEPLKLRSARLVRSL